MQIDANVAGQTLAWRSARMLISPWTHSPRGPFTAKLCRTRRTYHSQTVVTYDTVIGVNNPDLKLKPGMTANVSIIVAQKDDALQIKNAALRYRPAEAAAGEIGAPRAASSGSMARPSSGTRRGTGRESRSSERTVCALSGGRPQPVQIKTGISDGVVTEVIEGLKEGDRIVTGELASKSASTPANPFSGGPRRFP
jgi:HlyD family secretion protein